MGPASPEFVKLYFLLYNIHKNTDMKARFNYTRSREFYWQVFGEEAGQGVGEGRGEAHT